MKCADKGMLVFIGLLLTSLFLPFEGHAQADPDPARFEEAIATFEGWDQKNAFPRNPILFTGSSSIVMWPTAKRFPGMPLINRGFGGSHISDVIHFVDRVVLKYVPRLIVFYAGDNDIAGDKTVEQVFKDYQQFVGLVHEALPETPIFFIPIKPSLARWEMWPEMKRANAMIATYSATHPMLLYVDTATPMLGKDGKPMPDLFLEDGLHMNPKGYDIWTEVLHPYLERYLWDEE